MERLSKEGIIRKKEHPRVLLVQNETQESIRAVIALTRLGCVVQEAHGFRSALAMWQHPTCHDVIFVDNIFQHGSAVEFAIAIRKKETWFSSKSVIVGLYETYDERAAMEQTEKFDAMLLSPLMGHFDLLRKTLVNEGRYHPGQGKHPSLEEFHKILSQQGEKERHARPTSPLALPGGETSDILGSEAHPSKSYAELNRRIRIAEAEIESLNDEVRSLRKWKLGALRAFQRVSLGLSRHEVCLMQVEDPLRGTEFWKARGGRRESSVESEEGGDG